MKRNERGHRKSSSGGRIFLLWGVFVLVSLMSMSLAFADTRTGASFLKIPVGARAIGLGQAATAMAGGAESLRWNAAGITEGSFALSRQERFEDTAMDFAGVALPVAGGRTYWGLSVIRLSYPEQEKRGLDRQKTGTFEVRDMAVGMALAKDWGSVQLGSQLDFIHQQVDGEAAHGFGLDMGLMYQTPMKALSLGTAVKHLGSKMKYGDNAYQLPLTISVGTIYQIARPFSLALDVHARPYQEQFLFSLGTEIIPLGSVTLRAGYLAKLAEQVAGSWSGEKEGSTLSKLDGLTGGAGFQLGRLRLDYAYSPMGELGTNQSLTLTSRW